MAGGPSDKVRVVIFGSGRGSNARALLDYALHHSASYEVVGILSDRCHAGVLDIAREYGIAGASIIPNEYSTVEEYIRALLGLLEQKKIEVIVLAGYLRRVPSEVVAAYAGRILNIHPALLPKFGGKGMYGLHVHRAVLAAGERCSGATIHIVTEEYDAGPILEQIRVPVFSNDTPEMLMARVQAVEHYFYPRVLDRFCCHLQSHGMKKQP